MHVCLCPPMVALRIANPSTCCACWALCCSRSLPQERFLRPDPSTVDTLVSLLSSKKIGVVAHFYMDPEVQGVLSSAAERWPHINISGVCVAWGWDVRGRGGVGLWLSIPLNATH
jgi:hypothetical protein